MKWLYPYDGTVFPGGIGAPVLQWSQGATADGVYVHLLSQKYEFTGCYKGSSPPELPIPEKEWATAFAQSGGKGDPLAVEITTIKGGVVSGPIKETWTFAIGSLKGTLYYNTYTSAIAGNNGAVMMLKPGDSAPKALLAIAGTVPIGPCISCHSLSADGSMIVAQKHSYPGGLAAPKRELQADDRPSECHEPDPPRLLDGGRLGLQRGLPGWLASPDGGRVRRQHERHRRVPRRERQ